MSPGREVAPMHCLFCDAPLPPGAETCPHCGTSAFDDHESNSLVQVKPNPYAMPTAPLYAVVPPPTSTLAIVSLVAGVLGWTFVPGAGAIAAVITGHLARREIRESSGRLGGDPLAVIGLVLGYTQVAIGLLVLAIIVVLMIVGFFFVMNMPN